MRQIARAAAVLLACAGVASCGGSETPARAVEPWPEADALFHQDPRWLGSDGGISIDLGRDRVAWLFPDTFVAISPNNTREESCLVRNTVGLMTGSDPETAEITFHWGTAPDGRPESFFPKARDICFAEDDSWFWPGDGERLGEDGPLLIFLMRLRPTNEGLGFAGDGFEAVLVTNPDADPGEWHVEPARVRPNPWGIELGEAGVFVDGNWLYAFGGSESFDVHLARWPIEDAAAGDLRSPKWWAGTARGFVEQGALRARPPPLFGEALPESVYRTESGRYVALQTVGFGGAALGVRTAPGPTGRWSPLTAVWSPPESARQGIFVYGFKAHPELDAGDAVAVTYATNAESFADVVRDESLGYPRFVQLRLAP